MANINESGYFLSTAVRVYPCAYRGNNIDPAAKYTTEHNITNAPVGLKHKNSYIVEASSTGDVLKVLKVVIGGYYFELTLGEGDSLANKKLVIEPKTIDDQEYLGAVLTNIDDESLNLDGEDDYFYGLQVQALEADDTLAPTSTSLVVFTADGEINQFAVLPEITHGKAEGETVLDIITVSSNASIGGTLAVAGETTLTGKATLGAGLDVTGDATLKADLNVTGTATLGVGLEVTGYTELKDGLTVSEGTTALQSGLEVTGNTTLQGGLTVSNISNLNGGIAVDTNKFNVEYSTGNTTVAGTLTAGTLTVNGDTELKGSLTVGSEVDDTTTLRGALTVDGTLTVNGTSVSAESAAVAVGSLRTESGNITCNGDLAVAGRTTLADDNIFIGNAALRNYLVDLIYPIGSIYMTMGADNPANSFGGRWKQISQGRVLLGANSSEYSAGAKGGNKSIKLTPEQVPLPEHAHNVEVNMALTCRSLGATGMGVVSGLTLGGESAE